MPDSKLYTHFPLTPHPGINVENLKGAVIQEQHIATVHDYMTVTFRVLEVVNGKLWATNPDGTGTVLHPGNWSPTWHWRPVYRDPKTALQLAVGQFMHEEYERLLRDLCTSIKAASEKAPREASFLLDDVEDLVGKLELEMEWADEDI